MAPPIVKLRRGDEFVLTLKYGNFTRTKHGYSIDGDIVVKDGITAPDARLYIGRKVRDQIAGNWPGRGGTLRAIVLEEGDNGLWDMVEVVPDPQGSSYDPEVRAWNNNTNSFEAVGWDDHPGAVKATHTEKTDLFAEKTDSKPALIVKAPVKAPVTASNSIEWGDLVNIAQECWDAAGMIMGFPADLAVADYVHTPGIDARYKMAYTLYSDARKMGLMPHAGPEDEAEEASEAAAPPADDDDLPF